MVTNFIDVLDNKDVKVAVARLTGFWSLHLLTFILQEDDDLDDFRYSLVDGSLHQNHKKENKKIGTKGHQISALV